MFVIFDTRAVFVIAPTVSLSINAAWFHAGKVSTRILARNAVPEMAAGRFVGTCGGRSRPLSPSEATSRQPASHTKLRPSRPLTYPPMSVTREPRSTGGMLLVIRWRGGAERGD